MLFSVSPEATRWRTTRDRAGFGQGELDWEDGWDWATAGAVPSAKTTANITSGARLNPVQAFTEKINLTKMSARWLRRSML
jgi:hypothetical protein